MIRLAQLRFCIWFLCAQLLFGDAEMKVRDIEESAAQGSFAKIMRTLCSA